MVMQEDIEETCHCESAKWNRPCIIELVGLPGSGKTTATDILKKNGIVRIEIFPYFRIVKYAPFFAFNFIRLLPDIFRLVLNRQGKRFLNKREVALMTILTGWNLALQRIASSKDQMVILEEGAICLLAKLNGFGSDILQDSCADAWWHKTYKKWAQTLDIVIMLDTPIPVLLKRIRSRELQYEIKEMSDEEACKYLEHIQEAQEIVTSKIKDESDGPAIIHVNTLNKSPDQIALEINSILCSGSFQNHNYAEEKPRKLTA